MQDDGYSDYLIIYRQSWKTIIETALAIRRLMIIDLLKGDKDRRESTQVFYPLQKKRQKAKQDR
jgi:hypothetical protein